MIWVLVLVIGYLIGSVSSSFFLGRLILRKDLSREGTGNLGAKNSMEVGGVLFGATVFIIDILKGAGWMVWVREMYHDPLLIYAGMISVILGHNYSLLLGFRGGKGLATMVGILAVVQPWVLLILVALAGFFVLLSRHAGVAAILAIIPYTLIFGLVTGDWRSWPFSLLLSGIVLSKHRPDEYATTAAFLHLRKG